MLYNEYSIPNTVNDKDMLDILKKVTGDDYQAWWAKNIDGHAKPDFDKLLAKAGLEISYGKKDEKKTWTGISARSHDNGLKISSVEKTALRGKPVLLLTTQSLRLMVYVWLIKV